MYTQLLNSTLLSLKVLQPKIWNENIMYPRYLYDGGHSRELPPTFLNWWIKYFGHDVKDDGY
jgi:hypothetical protein